MVNLSDFKKNITSENGEDGIIEEIFRLIGVREKWCVEFGASNGKDLCNTWNLVNNHSWNAIYIEPDDKNFSILKKRYKDNDKILSIKKMVLTSGENTLDNILSKTKVPKNFDLLSIDIDGNDYHIWKSLTQYRPRIVIIENNGTIPPSINFICPKDSYGLGSSTRAIVELGKKKGYELIAHTGPNCIFITQEEFKNIKIKDNSLEKNFCDLQIRYVMSSYDGRKFLIGIPVHGFQKTNLYTRCRKFLADIYKSLFRKSYVKTKKILEILQNANKVKLNKEIFYFGRKIGGN
jgi:hypothetical protein